MEDVIARQVVGLRDLRLPCRLLVPLLCHQRGAVLTQLHAGKGVDAVIDAGVARDVAARHTAVRGVDDGPALEARDVPLPEVKVTTDRPQIVEVGNALVCQLLPQVLVLHAQKRFVCHFRHTDIHQRAQQLALLPRVPRHVQALVFRFFVQ